MSDLLTFPAFPLAIHSRPVPVLDTAMQASASGSEARVSRAVTRYRIKVRLQLRAWLDEDGALFRFFEAVGGKRDSFLFTDSTGVVRRVRFDQDDLESIEFEVGGIYSGEINLISVVD